MKNLKIRMKILLGFAVAVVILLSLGIFSLYQMNKINKQTQEISANWMPSIYHISDMNTNKSDLRLKEYRHVIAKTKEEKESIEKDIQAILSNYDNHVITYQKLISGDEEQKLYNEVKLNYDRFIVEHEAILKLSRQNMADSAIKVIYGGSTKLFYAWSDALTALVEFNKKNGDASAVTANNVYTGAMTLVIISIILAIIISIITGSFIASTISKGIIKMDNAAKGIAVGNMEVDLQVYSGDEVGSLAKSFREMKDSLSQIVEKAKLIAKGDLTVSLEKRSDKDELIQALNDMIGKVADVVGQFQIATNQIADVSGEISAGAQQLSQGASEQASSAEEISSSMEQMASNIQQNNDNAQQTEKIALMAATNIKQGNVSASKSATAMKEIADKISIISEIAFQTNILALNAAVEAARAGEHGRGFAVVAAEVRKLAERSKVAAEEINHVSKDGVEIASKAGQQLQEIVPEIEKTSKLVQEISAASIEQNSGADQINSAIQQLNTVTQQNASASEELATSAEELANQSEQLKELILFFKLPGSKAGYRDSNWEQRAFTNARTKEQPRKHISGIPLKNEDRRGANIKLSGQEMENRDNNFEKF
ncbi:MAG TPA: methyl-accepting chemotaxis protein [Bacteroidales bacterium]